MALNLAMQLVGGPVDNALDATALFPLRSIQLAAADEILLEVPLKFLGKVAVYWLSLSFSLCLASIALFLLALIPYTIRLPVALFISA